MVLRTCLIAAALAYAPSAARAAESYDNCSGTIASLPAVISTQGVWCLTSDVASTLSSGNVLTIAANNVTLDCNHFKIGGLGAGPATTANGIRADGRLNVRVRNCHVRGFYRGVVLAGGAGHVVEDNQVDGNRAVGIYLSADASTVRRNLVVDTGAASTALNTVGIFTGGRTHVIDNTVDGVDPNGSEADAMGIYSTGDGASIVGNRVAGLLPGAGGSGIGIEADGLHARVSGNWLYGGGAASSIGIYCASASTTARDNDLGDFDTGIFNCYSLDNVVQAP